MLLYVVVILVWTLHRWEHFFPPASLDRFFEIVLGLRFFALNLITPAVNVDLPPSTDMLICWMRRFFIEATLCKSWVSSYIMLHGHCKGCCQFLLQLAWHDIFSHHAWHCVGESGSLLSLYLLVFLTLFFPATQLRFSLVWQFHCTRFK